ncbi:MAG: TVP38/TMEM64 family protein [Alphaproteobacteria bacterium]|nr:TVP38/TMEM64 family protein [Alphaproteobacteria bacterium]
MNIDARRMRPPSFRRALLFGPVAVALALFFALGLDRYVTLQALAENREWLTERVGALGAAGPLAFVVLYALLVAASIPGATFLTLVGGFLFGTALGAFCTLVGGTIGATLIFLLARTALGDVLRARAGPAMHRLEAGFRKNALFYLLFLRLVPLFPFFIVNLVPAFLGVPLRAFVIGTAIGIIPGTIIYAGVGSGLGAVFASGGTAKLQHVTSDPAVWGPLAALAFLSLVPIAYRSWRGERPAR